VPTVFPEDRCDVCHEWALMEDSDLVLCQCGRELWVHDRCVEAGGPCPKCGVRWTEQDAERVSGAERRRPK
jgi:hypothetical protein